MATILSFRPMTARKTQRPPFMGDAVIVIFPGVRYERRDGTIVVKREPPKPAARPKSALREH
jgi:hypothetical protein